MKRMQEHGNARISSEEPLIHRETLLDYERLSDPAAISRAILTFEGESVLIRNPFRWTKDGLEIPDAYAEMPLDLVCSERGWKIVERYGEHMAIVSEA